MFIKIKFLLKLQILKIYMNLSDIQQIHLQLKLRNIKDLMRKLA